MKEYMNENRNENVHETEYIEYRREQARSLSLLFHKMIAENEIVKNRIVFSSFEGDGGFGCNPRYIAEELIKRGGYELIWLTHEPDKHDFPKEIRVIRDTAENQAYWLSTAKVWIDNYRKAWGTIKREGQIYIQTWHASMGFKAVGLFRGDKFPKIARIVSEADSAMIDYMLSNSDYCDKIYPKKLLYSGETLKSGSPRCDCLIKRKKELYKKIREKYHIPQDAKIVMYAPTFRGGTQKNAKNVDAGAVSLDFEQVRKCLTHKFGGTWFVFLKLHPQLSAKLDKMPINHKMTYMVDVSVHEDMSELLGASEILITDYSSCAFDAMFAYIPVFLYADDVQEYVEKRGTFMWKKEELPFCMAETNEELINNLEQFEEESYKKSADAFMEKYGVVETGNASKIVVDKIEKLIKDEKCFK